MKRCGHEKPVHCSCPHLFVVPAAPTTASAPAGNRRPKRKKFKDESPGVGATGARNETRKQGILNKKDPKSKGSEIKRPEITKIRNQKTEGKTDLLAPARRAPPNSVLFMVLAAKCARFAHRFGRHAPSLMVHTNMIIWKYGLRLRALACGCVLVCGPHSNA